MRREPKAEIASGMETVEIANVTVASEFQMRVKSDPATLIEYRELIRASEEHWPFDEPCTLYRVDGKLILTDGFHRLEAMHAEGRTEIRADVRNGTLLDAKIASLGANKKHGLRRSNADKRRSVTIAVQDNTLQQWSDHKLAKLCGVSHPFVGQVRGEPETVTSSPQDDRVGSDGKNYPSNASKARQQREAIQSAIEANPNASDRETADKVGCDHKTVGKVRRDVLNAKPDPPAPVIAPEPQPKPIEEKPVAPGPISGDILKQAEEFFPKFLEALQALDRDSPECKVWYELLNKTHAAATSHCCDMSPVEQVREPKKVPGALFPDAIEEKPQKGRMVPTDEEFEAFYQAYPRRVNKANAKVAFAKAFKTLRKTLAPDAVIETIMQGVSVYAKHANPDVLCHPTTWLNGCRWEDDPGSIGTPATRTVAPIQVNRGKYGLADPEFRKLSLEEQQRAVLQ